MKQNFGSMVKEATKHMRGDMKPMSGKMPTTVGVSKKRKVSPAYGRGGKKGRFQYGVTKVKGYADPLD